MNDPCNDFLQFRATCGNLFPTRYGADVVRIKSSVRPRSCLEWKTTSAIVPPTSQRGSSIRHLVHDARNDGWRRAFAEIVPRFSHRDRTYVLELPINREILRYFPSSSYRRLVTRCIEIEKHDRLHYFLPRESTKRFGYLVANDRVKIFHFNRRIRTGIPIRSELCRLLTDVFAILLARVFHPWRKYSRETARLVIDFVPV